MNFLPGIPQISQQNQGTNFGNWQQYAGYGRTNPFGGYGGIVPKTTSNTGVPAPVEDKSISSEDSTNTQPNISNPISLNTTMGASPNMSMGLSLTPKNNISNDIYSAFGVSK